MLRVPNLFQQTLRSSSRLFTHLKHTDGIQPPARVGIVNHQQQHRGIKTHSNFSQQHFLARVAQTQPNPSSTSKFFSSEAVAEAEAEGPVPTNTGRKKVSYDDRIDSSFVFSGNDSYHNPLEKYEVAADLFASQADYEKVLAICKKLRQPTFRVLNALLKAYIRAGLMGKVPEVFEQLRRFPAEDGGAIGSSYSALLELYVGYGFLREARNVLYKMCEDKMPPASNAMGELIDLHFERGNVDEALYYVQYLESLKLINHTVYDSFLNNLWQMCEDEYFYNFLKKFVVHIQKSIDRKIPVDYYEYLARGAALARKPKDAFVFHEYLLDHTSNIEPIVTEEVLQCMLDNLKGRTPWLRRTLFRSALRGIRVTGETWNQCLAYFFETGDYSSVIYAYQVMKRDLFLVAPSAQYVIFQAAVAVGTPESLGLIPELLTESSMDISLREQALQTLIDIQLNADHPLEVGEVLDKIYEILIQPGAPRNSTKFYALLIDYQLSRNQPTNAKTLLTSTIEKLTLESVSVQSLNLARRGIDIQVPEDEAPKQAISLQNLTEEQLAQLDPEGLATYTALILSGEPLPTWEEIFAPPPETVLNPNNQDPDDFLATTQDSAARYAEDGQEHLDPVFHTGFERATEQLQSRTGDMLILPEDHEFHGNRVFSYAQYLPQVERILNTDEDALFSMISYSNQTAVGDKPVESWSDDEPIEPVLAPEPHYPDSDALEETLYKLKTYRTDDEDESADLALDSPDPVDSTSVVDVDADGLDSGSDGAEGSVGIDLNFVANPNYADYAEDDSSLDEAGEPLPEELRWQEPQDSALDDARNSDLLSDESDAVELVSDESDGLQESEGELEADGDPASELSATEGEGELELDDDAETDTDDVEGGSVVYQSVFPTHHRRMRNFIKAHLAENNLIVENVQAREELLAYRDMLENNEALGRKEFLQVSGMWSSVVVYLLANSSADSASKLVQDVLEQVPMATPPSMTVLNLIAKAYVDQNASDRAERMFETLSVRPNRNTLSLLLEPLLSSSSKHDAAYEKFCSLVTKFQVAPNEATTVKLVQSFVSKSKPEQAITILENAAHHNVVLPLSHFKDVFSLFLSRKDYYNAAVVASDAVNYLYTNELVEKLLDTMVAHNQVPFALEILNEMIPETDFETVQQLFSPLVSLYKSKGLDVIGDHIFYAIDQLRISLIEFTEPAEQTSLPAPGADQPNVEIHDSDIFSKSLGIFSPELEQHVKE